MSDKIVPDASYVRVTHLEFLLVQNIIACIFGSGKNVEQNSSNSILRYGYLSRVSTGPEHKHPAIIPVLFAPIDILFFILTIAIEIDRYWSSYYYTYMYIKSLQL